MSILNAEIEQPMPGGGERMRNDVPIEDLGISASDVLDAAQALRRTIRGVSTPGDSIAVLTSLEATLDSLGASLAEMRGPLLEHVAPRRGDTPESRTAQLDGARLVAQLGVALSDAATACGDLRKLVAGQPAQV
jgi:hypothetical protein